MKEMKRVPACLLLSVLVLAAVPTASAQITEWPTTVAPGRFLLEMDAVSLTVDRAPGFKYTAFGAASPFLTTGLTHNWDIQVGAELFISQKVELGGRSDRNSGIGDVYVRTKYRFYEDSETGTAVAFLPYVKIPTNTGNVGNDAVEGGVIVPWTTTLTGGFDVAAMAGIDVYRNDNDDGYDLNLYGSASLTRKITGALGVYGEVALAKSSGASSAEGIMGGGVTLSVSENTWWDFAIYKGISSAAADWNQVIRFNFGFY